MNTANAVIIGGGVIGASIAYHLSVNGLKNVIVLDGAPAPGTGKGSTARATGGFRAQFGSEINIKLSLLSREKLFSFKDETGTGPGFNQRGYLFLAGPDEELEKLNKANLLQRNCGLTEAEVVDVEIIRKLNPHINLNGITGGAFCHSDGFIKPMEILKGYTEAAERNGVRFIYDADITGFQMKSDEILSAKTAQGEFYSDVFVNAAGAWAANIAAFAGIEIPVIPLKRQVGIVKQPQILPENVPMTVWVNNSFHFRMRDGYLILLMPEPPSNPDPYNTEPEIEWLNKVFDTAKSKIPVLKNAGFDIKNSWAGLYEMSPDEHVLLGKTPGIKNFYMACGSSGHGVMHSPALGELLAQLITGNQTTFNISSLDPSRFQNGKPISQIHFF